MYEKASATRANKFSGTGIENENISSKELAEELQKLKKKISTFLVNR